MIRALAVTTAGELLRNVPLERLSEPDIRWYWVDLDRPAEEETALLASHFRFHPLAIEDCLHLSQRAKLDHYGDVHFFVLHAIRRRWKGWRSICSSAPILWSAFICNSFRKSMMPGTK